MCCQIVCGPIDVEIAKALLAVGQFEPTGTSDRYWARQLGLDEMGRKMAVKASIEINPDGTAQMRLFVEPSITAYDHHAGRRVQASTALEIATRVAEKVGAEIQQLANVVGCSEDGVRSHLLASYPEYPMRYESLCRGFQELYLGLD